jgi:hypothetical protein
MLIISLPVEVRTVKHFASENVKICCCQPMIMAETIDKQQEMATRFDPQFQTENIAFDPDRLLTCDGCGRKNAPNRLACMYCGHELVVPEKAASAIKPVLRKLEAWEHGFNLILLETAGDIDIGKTANFLSMENADLALIINAGRPLPLLRVESESVAATMQTAMQGMGIRCSIVADDDLTADQTPVRLASIEITHGDVSFHAFNTGNVYRFHISDFALIIQGVIVKSKVESNEKNRRKKENKIIDEAATISDEAVIDIYMRGDATGFRIYPAGFDFSILGSEKSLLARENLTRLIALLERNAPMVKVVSDYQAIRYALGIVWEVESRTDTLGLRQTGYGKREFGRVASTSNLSQFTKYSRLQRHLL